MTTGIYNSGYNDYFYNQYNYANPNQSVNRSSNQYATTSTINDQDTANLIKKRKVEKDDGKIGFFKAAKNLLKGGVKFFTGMFTDDQGNFSLGKTIKTALFAAGIAAVTVLTAGTAVPAMIAAAGIGMAAVGTGKAVYDIATAETDAEAEQAWQSLGANATAGTLALVGAKAVAKSAPGAAASEFKGVSGYFKAGKQVFQDSGKAIGKSFKGVKTAYTNGEAGITGKASAVYREVKSQGSSFKNTVEGNFNKTVYGAKGKVQEDSKAVDKEMKEINDKQAKVKDKKSAEYKKLETRKTELKAKQDAYAEMKGKDNWESANEAIDSNKATLKAKQDALKNAKTDAEKAQLKDEISALKTKIKQEESILTRRTQEAQYIEKQIKSKQEKLEKLRKEENPDTNQIAKVEQEIQDLNARKEFKIPNGIKEEQVKTARETVEKNKTAYDEAQKKYDELKTESATNDRAYARLEKAEAEAQAAKTKYEASQKAYNEIDTRYNVQEGTGFTYSSSEIARAAKNNPVAKWLTIGAAGKQFGFADPNVDFYTQLNSQERAYFKSLPVEQQQALIEMYQQAIA